MVRDSMKHDYDPRLPHQSHGGSNSRVSMNKSSHAITKVKPKIRIIHIVAPKIMETDVKNFSSLVQNLTGKQAAEAATKTGRKRTKPEIPVMTNRDSSTGHHHHHPHHDQVNRLTGFEFPGLLHGAVKEEEWSLGECSNSNTYFDLEDLIDLGDDFSQFPMESSDMDSFMFNNTSDQTKGH